MIRRAAKAARGKPQPVAIRTSRRLERGVLRSVADLQAAINRYLDEHYQDEAQEHEPIGFFEPIR